MQYGICHLSVVPIRLNANHSAEMVSQLLYGEHYKILEQRKTWSRIRGAFDSFEGWVSNTQLHLIKESEYNDIEASDNYCFTTDLVSFVEVDKTSLIPILLGSTIHSNPILPHKFEGTAVHLQQEKSNLITTALLFLNAPFVSGGRSPFGIDAAGITQMIYKINGQRLKRTAIEQSAQGEALSFIEESEPGDLAFFDNTDGIIDHVGIIMENNYIIHASGKIRIDRLDHTGIFNSDKNQYTHKLRVIKKMV